MMTYKHMVNLPFPLELDYVTNISGLKVGDIFIFENELHKDDFTIFEYIAKGNGIGDSPSINISYYSNKNPDSKNTLNNLRPDKKTKLVKLKKNIDDLPDFNKVVKYSTFGVCATIAVLLGLSLFNKE